MLYEDEIRSVEGPDARRGAARRRDLSRFPLQVRLRNRCGNAEKGRLETQRPPYPAAQVLAWLAECEMTQVSHSFALLKQVRWWEEPALDASGLGPRLRVRRVRSFLSFRLKP